MKNHSATRREWASRENEADAAALFKKWCFNPNACIRIFRENEIEEWEPRFDRPVSEPPVFDYEAFVKDEVPSDIRLDKLFPGDPVKKTAYRDFLIMEGLVRKYWRWAESMVREDPLRAGFYRGFCVEVYEDHITDRNAAHDLPWPDDRLAVWEYHNLDQDGDTKEMRKAMERGQDIFHETEHGPAIENMAI